VNNLIINKSNIHGYGIFTESKILKGEIFDISLTYKLEYEDYLFLSKYHYSYVNNDGKQIKLLMLGPPNYYNHSNNPNSKIYHVFNGDNILIKSEAITDIEKGEEITILYFEGATF
jgi:SET domain-containing protein